MCTRLGNINIDSECVASSHLSCNVSVQVDGPAFFRSKACAVAGGFSGPPDGHGDLIGGTCSASTWASARSGKLRMWT